MQSEFTKRLYVKHIKNYLRYRFGIIYTEDVEKAETVQLFLRRMREMDKVEPQQ